MKIYVVGSSKNNFLQLDNIREKFLVDVKHDGDNIDHLNPWYCELTGLYYLFKHNNDNIVGIEHYRRYFVNEKNQILAENEILSILEKNDIIMYKYIGTNGYKDMVNAGKKTELALALAIVNVNYGSDMSNYFKNKLMNETYVYEGNMFICKKELIEEYCKFIFKVLSIFDEAHKFKIPRIDGYIAEYLFGPWMEYKQKKIYNCSRQTFTRDLKIKLRGHV